MPQTSEHPRPLRRLCVFCGASNGARPVYVEAARRLAEAMVDAGVGLVYGGASVGVMGALANAVLERGGEVIGVIPRALVDREIAHQGLDELRVVNTMHERKAQMAELADAFVALPGGLGTLEELFEVWTWAYLGLHSKPFGLLEVERFFAPLVHFLDHAAGEGFIRPPQRAMLHVDSDPTTLLMRLAAAARPAIPAAIDPADR